MIELLRHVLQPAYLFAQNRQAGGIWQVVHTRWIATLLLGLLLALWWARRLRRRGLSPLAGWLAAGCFAMALCCQVIRFRVSGIPSARIWWLSATMLGLATIVLHRLGHRRWPAPLRLLGRALALRLDPRETLPARWQLGLCILHALGMFAALRLETAGIWPPLAALGLLAAGSWGGYRHAGRLRLRIELLTPLLGHYAALLLRWLPPAALGVDVTAYQAFPYPDLCSPLFRPGLTWSMALAWSALLTGSLLMSARRHGPRPCANPGRPCTGWVLLAGGALWYAFSVLMHHSHGATGSDPYCYLQMAVDLATKGSPLHVYPLADLARCAGVSLWPTVPVGYHAPLGGNMVRTVWPLGWPLLLAPFVWLGGEGAALLAAPSFALLAAWLTFLAGRELWPGQGHLLGGLAALLLLTSPESLLRAVVPMADAAAQACTALLLWALARARRSDQLRWSTVAGVALATAYFVRHPLIWLAPAGVLALACSSWSSPRRGKHLAALALGMAPCLLLDLVYRWRVFASPWATESPEWFLISWRNVLPTLGRTLQDGWLRRGEFGYLWPLIIVGLGAMWRDRRQCVLPLLLGAGFVGALGFQLCYRALRWRDLISLFPFLALWAGYGICRLWQWARGRSLRRVLVLALLLVLVSARTVPILDLPWRGTIEIFGYVSARQRAAYDQLAVDLPENAVIGTGLGAGSIAHYTGRATVRPAAWTPEELNRFVALLKQGGRPFYLLDDGEEMRALLATLRGIPMSLVGSYDLPRFGQGGEGMSGSALCYAMVF